MKTSTFSILKEAQNGKYAVGAFNVYNLEEIKAVVKAAEILQAPVILQIHPAAYSFGGNPLLKACMVAADVAETPVAVHFDHCKSIEMIHDALQAGVDSVMADGSHMSYEENISFTRSVVKVAKKFGASVEAELGMISGKEDGLDDLALAAKMTDPDQAGQFLISTGVDFLAICIGNVHGHYPKEPNLDFERLKAIRKLLPNPLVLHGASGLPNEMIETSIQLGICKINVNTDLRQAYLDSIRMSSHGDLLDLMQTSVLAVQKIVEQKIKLMDLKRGT